MTKFYESPTWKGATEIIIYETEHPTLQAKLAMDLMRQLAIVAHAVDGEDSAGRQKARLLAPHEVAERACMIVDAAYARFKARGWIVETPDPKPARARTTLPDPETIKP